MGKTTLAHIVASEIAAPLRIAAGPTLERVGDLAAILTNIEEGGVLFIDEIHRLNKTIEEILYSAMEEYALDIIIGKGPSAKTLRIDLPRFTLIGATTRLSLLSAPLRDRFRITYHLKFYEPQEIEKKFPPGGAAGLVFLLSAAVAIALLVIFYAWRRQVRKKDKENW